MTLRLLLPIGLVASLGITLLLAETRWFHRIPLVERLAPYAPGRAAPTRPPFGSVESAREILRPLAHGAGEHLARLFGVNESLDLRLQRIHSPADAAAFRLRQLSWAGIAFAAGTAAAVATQVATPLAILTVVGAPVLAFLLVEQTVATRSDDWKRRTTLELPVVTEQLAMLMSAGWSLTAALDRIAARGHGTCATDLGTVVRRIRQGLGESVALREWADRVDVASLHRLVSVLALNRETADLGHLITAEARAMRRDAQRDLIESIERRSQQVWIPVTVAALVPGVLLMGVPFVDALRVFSTG